MKTKEAISIIESCAGFSDETSPAGEAWMVIMSELEEARNLIMGIGCVSDSESPRKAQEWLVRNFPQYA